MSHSGTLMVPFKKSAHYYGALSGSEPLLVSQNFVEEQHRGERGCSFWEAILNSGHSGAV